MRKSRRLLCRWDDSGISTLELQTICAGTESVLTDPSIVFLQIIQEAGGTLTAIGVGDVHLTVQAPGGHHDIVLTGVLHCPILFRNLISASSLRKKGWYFHGGTETLNRCDNDFHSRLPQYKTAYTYCRTCIHHPWLPLLTFPQLPPSNPGTGG